MGTEKTLCLMLSSTRSNKSLVNNDSTPETLDRDAIDPSGVIGSLYDATRDVIRGKVLGGFPSVSVTSKADRKCLCRKSTILEFQNLLDVTGMDNHLQLSIHLRMIPLAGIASLIDYAGPIDESTRLIYFSRISSEESFRDRFEIDQSFLNSSSDGIPATHIITAIRWGITVILVLQLSPNHDDEIDNLLSKLCDDLRYNRSNTETVSPQSPLYPQIISTSVYSNIPELRTLTNFSDAYHRIIQLDKNRSEHQRVSYTMLPLAAIRQPDSVKCLEFPLLYSPVIEEFKKYLLQQLSELKLLYVRLQHAMPKVVRGELKNLVKEAHKQLEKIQGLHSKHFEKLGELLINARQNKSILGKNTDSPTEQPARAFRNTLDLLESKAKDISDLEQNKVAYCDVTEFGIKKGYSDQLVRDILRQEYPNKTVICANDSLRISNATEWSQHYSQFVEAVPIDGDLKFVFADFTYSTYELKTIETMEPRRTIMEENLPKSESAADPYINILLLGESGVGKSTFINAFANYLRFETLEDAEKHEPSVVIPVSFIMTSGADFHEHVVQFGDPDSNEAHNKIAQSVTQRCQCYVLDIADGRKLRLIDTPGFGDSRGAEQDELNMSEIFAFTHSLPYLNGICLLLKPNVNKLHAYFRSCFNQLLNFFGPTLQEHLIFCFTNARSTFFAPGDTKPMLTAFFQSSSIKEITIHKENTFCFDSESFRYLVALKNSVRFDQIQREEFEQSWLQSAAETKRFRHRLLQQKAFRQCEARQSDAHARLQIRWLVRPICEGIRNILRNTLLHEQHQSIKLCAKSLKEPKMICYECSQDLKQYGPLWILADCLHNPKSTVSFEFFLPLLLGSFCVPCRFLADRTFDTP